MNGNQMDITSPFITSKEYINVSSQNISDLTGIQYFSSLKYLFCSNNNLTFLPPLPSTLKQLGCIMNQLTCLPDLPDSLTYLYCIQNNLTELPPLPSTLGQLYCEQNNLTSLPDLPDSLWFLSCYDNNITELPALPIKMQSVDCSNNQITNIVSLNPDLKVLLCHYNQLTSLPPLPQLERLTCYNNNISCFPVFPSSIQPKGWNSHNHYWVYYLVINNNPFDCLPNYLPDAMDPTTLSYPLCAEGNANGCPVVTGVEEKTLCLVPQLFPNPTSSKLQIIGSMKCFSLYNSLGILVLETKQNELDVSALPCGIYFAKVISDGKMFTEKIVIEH